MVKIQSIKGYNGYNGNKYNELVDKIAYDEEKKNKIK
jgi:hypothetical protein